MNSVLFVSEYSGFAGGIERYLYKTALMLRRNGWKVYAAFRTEVRDSNLFQSGFDGAFFLSQLDEIPDEIRVAVVHKVSDPETLRKISERFRTAAVIHDHEYYCPGRSLYFPFSRENCSRGYSRFTCGVCGMLRKKSRSHPISSLVWNFETFPRIWKQIRNTRAQVVLSEFMRGTAVRSGADPEKIRLIPPFVSTDSEADPDSEVPHILSAGQLIRGKGGDLLMKAVPMIRGDFILDILGSGEDEPMLRELAKPFASKIHFHGWSNTPETLFSQASLVVLPWRWQEPFGLVGAEALAQGIPVVGFQTGGISEYLINGKTGISVPAGNLEEFADAVSKLLADPDLRARMGREGRCLIEKKFSEDAAVAGWDDLFKELMK